MPAHGEAEEGGEGEGENGARIHRYLAFPPARPAKMRPTRISSATAATFSSILIWFSAMTVCCAVTSTMSALRSGSSLAPACPLDRRGKASAAKSATAATAVQRVDVDFIMDSRAELVPQRR